MRAARTALLFSLLSLVLAACSGGGDDDAADGSAPGSAVAPPSGPEASAGPGGSPPPEGTAVAPAALPASANLSGLVLAATPVADIDLLTAMAWRPGDPNPYLADQHGHVYHLVNGSPESVLDLAADVMDWQPGAEYGFLAMTFDPVNGRLIVCYNGNDVDTRLQSFAIGADGKPDPASKWEILVIDKPGVGHNCGQLAWDAQNNLIFSHGDGGGSRGADAQDMGTLLGGLFRITPNRDAPGYTVPPDNPFVGREGIAPEIWAKGMRNPWRFSIDPATGDIWVGDVGESTYESVYRIPAGRSGVNGGWPSFEGGQYVNFNPAVQVPAEVTLPPLHAYTHNAVGPAVIGGYVYRGTEIPQLIGAYLFADMTGPVFAMGSDDVVRVQLAVPTPITSFAQDPQGELYVLTLNDGAFRLHLPPPPGTAAPAPGTSPAAPGTSPAAPGTIPAAAATTPQPPATGGAPEPSAAP